MDDHGAELEQNAGLRVLISHGFEEFGGFCLKVQNWDSMVERQVTAVLCGGSDGLGKIETRG